MHAVVALLRGIDWASPHTVALVVLLTVFALLRKWFLLTMTLLVITLGRGLCHLQMNREVLSESNLTTATIVYLVGGIIIVTVAAIQFFVKE